jgi:hypothetical protein
MLDSDTDQPMRTPATNSPPTSGDERSPPSTPPTRTRVGGSIDAGMLMQVSDLMADNEDIAEVTGKKKREEMEWQLAAQAEREKLLDKEWREGNSRFGLS